MSANLDIKIRNLIGSIVELKISQSATVLDMKQELHRKDPSCPHYQQRLLADNREELADDKVLSSYPCLRTGAVVNLLVVPPFELYVTDMCGRQHTAVVPSRNPKEYFISDLRVVLEAKMGQTMDGYHIIFNGKQCTETKDGRKTTLGDYGIEKEDTIVIGKMTIKDLNPTVDLCFMVDCTGSMGSWIEGVKNNVKQLRDKLAAQFPSCDLRFAFVRYTDYDQPEGTRTTTLNFTRDQSSFHRFVGGITADGGGDDPEDIMGALKVTLNSLSWRTDVDKVLIHIADAPCHGTQYHDQSGGDTYPNGDPVGISHDHMMQQVASRNIYYWFGYIQRQSTDKMISVFNESLTRWSNNRLTIRQVDATNADQLADAFFKSVKGTIFASEAARRATVRHYVLNPSIPQWSSVAQMHCTKTIPVSMPGVGALQRGFIIPEPSIPICIQCAPDPFEEGEESVAYHGYDVTNQRQVVLKQFKREGPVYSGWECYNKVLLIHAISTAYASDFNAEKSRPMGTSSLVFISTDLVQCTKGGQVVHYVFQQFVGGKFEKFNGNSGLVFSQSPWSEPMQAFSHYTYVKSGKTLLICDLQGVVSGSCISLGDPAIHSRTEEGNNFGPTDLGFSGIEQFMKTHKCGDTCRRLGL